jgi:hypothetical protein
MMSIGVRVGENFTLPKRDACFYNLLDTQYQPEVDILGFYNHYRSRVIASLKKKGDVIVWQNNKAGLWIPIRIRIRMDPH